MPLSRVSGATPTRAAIWPWESRPRAGRSARTVSERIGPRPGTRRSRSSRARQSGLARRRRRSSSSPATRSASSQARWAGMRGWDAGTYCGHPCRASPVHFCRAPRHHRAPTRDACRPFLGRAVRAGAGAHRCAAGRHYLGLQPLGRRHAPRRTRARAPGRGGPRHWAGRPSPPPPLRRRVAPGSRGHAPGQPRAALPRLRRFLPAAAWSRRRGAVRPRSRRAAPARPSGALLGTLPCRPRRPRRAGDGRSAQLAQAPVRTRWGDGRDGPSASAASRDRRTNGRSRPHAAGHCAILHDSSDTRDETQKVK
jgi:hypothetical protein